MSTIQSSGQANTYLAPTQPPPVAPAPAPAAPTQPSQGTQIPGLAPMTPPAPLPSTPSVAPLPTTPTSGFGPGNDLRTTQINPTADPRLASTQGQVDQTASKLSNGPDRFQIAQDRFKTFADQTDPAFQASLRSAGQKAASIGAVGSGMAGTDVGNLELARERQLSGERSGIFQNALEGTIGDTRANVGLLSGLEGQQYGEGAAGRNELRGERGYQNGMEQQAYDRGVQGLTLEDQLTNSALGRGLAQTEAGSSGNPAQTQLLLSQLYGNQGSQAGSALSGMIQGNATSGILDSVYGDGIPKPPAQIDTSGFGLPEGSIPSIDQILSGAGGYAKQGL